MSFHDCSSAAAFCSVLSVCWLARTLTLRLLLLWEERDLDQITLQLPKNKIKPAAQKCFFLLFCRFFNSRQPQNRTTTRYNVAEMKSGKQTEREREKRVWVWENNNRQEGDRGVERKKNNFHLQQWANCVIGVKKGVWNFSSFINVFFFATTFAAHHMWCEMMMIFWTTGIHRLSIIIIIVRCECEIRCSY